MPFEPKLPRTYAKSLLLKPHAPSVLVKVRTHEKKAEALRDERKEAERQDDARDDANAGAHQEYIERWRALEHAVTPIEARVRHEWKNKLGEEPKPHQVIGHLIANLPRPRQDALYRDPRLVELNVTLGHRDLRKIVEKNELLQDLGIDWQTFLDAKRDLKFQLGLQSYRSAMALACYLTVIRAACDPKVRKTRNFVADGEVLTLAGDILRDVTTHIVEEMQAAHDSFFAVGDRQAVGEQFRIDRAKRSGRPVPRSDAPKGRPLPKDAVVKPKPGALKG